MYCINCGVKLADTEKSCPLCNTSVWHPEVKQAAEQPLYPAGKMPKGGSGSKILCGAIVILFFVPLVICFFSDLHSNGQLDWFGYVAGALAVAYTVFALPLWFKKANPVIFVPCDFAAAMLYLLYINYATGGDWFLRFAFPVAGGLCLITCSVVTLLCCLRRGRLYVVGGASIALGALMLLIEFLLDRTFDLRFVGWSIYPLLALVFAGGVLIYLAISSAAREVMERKLFF